MPRASLRDGRCKALGRGSHGRAACLNGHVLSIRRSSQSDIIRSISDNSFVSIYIMNDFYWSTANRNSYYKIVSYRPNQTMFSSYLFRLRSLSAHTALGKTKMPRRRAPKMKTTPHLMGNALCGAAPTTQSSPPLTHAPPASQRDQSRMPLHKCITAWCAALALAISPPSFRADVRGCAQLRPSSLQHLD